MSHPMKVCSAGCSKKPKPLTDYHRKAQMHDGHASRCKVCVNKGKRAYRRANIDAMRAYYRQVDRYRRAHRAEYQRAYRARLKQTTTTHKAIP